MARASTPTLLSLDRYAKILGISPPHFNQGVSNAVFPASGGCDDVWFQHQWQKSDRISREELAEAIYNAEEDIARVLGYYPAPKWIAQEQHRYPRHHRRDVYSSGGLNVRGQGKSIQTRYGKFIQGGQRALTANTPPTASVAGLTLTYDTDVQDLTATVEVATTFTNECEVKVYFAGHNGAPEWEIRPATTKTIALGVFTAVFPIWLFIDPDLWEEYPTTASGLNAIDFTDTDNLVASVEIYREYNDYTATAATFYWEPRPSSLYVGGLCTSCGGAGCAACSLASQDGCLGVRNVEAGLVVPTPATYSDDDEAWSEDCFSECRDPDMVRLYYYAGDQDNRYLDRATCEPLSNYWAQAIAWLATARLERTFCSCVNVQSLAQDWRKDLAFVKDSSYQFAPELLSNPFGTRYGEVKAWQRVAKIQGRQLKGGAI